MLCPVSSPGGNLTSTWSERELMQMPSEDHSCNSPDSFKDCNQCKHKHHCSLRDSGPNYKTLQFLSNTDALPHKCSCHCARELLSQSCHWEHRRSSQSYLTGLGSTHISAPEKQEVSEFVLFCHVTYYYLDILGYIMLCSCALKYLRY